MHREREKNSADPQGWMKDSSFQPAYRETIFNYRDQEDPMKVKLFPLMSLLLIFGLTGCNGIKNTMRVSEKDSHWNPIRQLTQEKKKDQKEDAQPTTMAAIWANTTYEQPGKPTIKGFGGRIFFYDEDNTTVKADGELIVYGFDDSIKNKEENVADRKFVFKQDKFQTHYSENDLGASYSVWIPWEPVGGFRKSITLIPMFKTADGRLIKCPQSISVLPGKTPKTQQVATVENKLPYRVLGSSSAVVRGANYETGTPLNSANRMVANTGYEAEADANGRIRTSTIRMTPGMSQRLAQANVNRKIAERAKLKHQSASVKPVAPVSDPKSATGSNVETKTTPTAENPAAGNSSDPKSNVRAFGQPGSWD